jgi:thiol-disulfide isomerase/thioredoxin
MLYSFRLLSFSVCALLLSAGAGLQAQEADTFAIPEEAKTFKQLKEFIEEIGSMEPEGQGEQELLAHRRKVARTVVAITEQGLKLELVDQEPMECHYFNLLALNMLQELGDPEAKEKFAKAVDVARAHSNPDVAAVGIKFLVEAGFGKWQHLEEPEKTELLDAIADYVQQGEIDGEQVQLVMTVVGFLGDAGEDQLAKQLLDKVTTAFSSSADEQVQSMAAMLEGISRRLDLPGKKIELTGSMLDGSELDWKSYRGKVVLVDFWATWCGPCRAEVPNVLSMYRAYHDKGFEVLGISLDNTSEDAETYIKQTEIPWPTMLSKDENKRSWQHPMAVHYGVTGIPLAILVDRDGTVISMQARGQELGNLLRKILGEPVASTKAVEDPLVQQVSGTAKPE